MAKKENEKIVSIPKEQWEKMLERLLRLEESASKAKLAHYDETHRKPVGKTVKIRKYQGKYVVAWSSMIQNIVERNAGTGVWHEDQIVEIYFSDGSKARFPYVSWERNYEKVECEVKKERVNDSGHCDVDVELPTGEQLTVGIEFVN